MTDTQLYLAIGIPSALFMLNFLGVLAGFFWQARRFDDMGKRFDDVGKRFDDVGKRFDDMKDLFRSEIGRVEGEFRSDLTRVEGVLGAKVDGLSVRVKALEDEIHSPLVRQ